MPEIPKVKVTDIQTYHFGGDTVVTTANLAIEVTGDGDHQVIFAAPFSGRLTFIDRWEHHFGSVGCARIVQIDGRTIEYKPLIDAIDDALAWEL